MINRSKRRSIIFKFNFSFLRMARSISISNSAICHRTLSLPPPLSPGSMKVETFERKHWLQIPLSCRRWFPSGDPNRILPLSIERPVNERFFPPALVYPQTFSPISICLIIIILESFFFFFFFSSLTSVASIDEIIEEEISPRSYVNAYGGQASRNNNR